LNEKLFFIYKEGLKNKTEQWKEEVLMILLKVEYSKNGDIYNKFITKNYLIHPKNSFYNIVLYCLINENKGVKLLADYYSKYFIFIALPSNSISHKEMFLFNVIKKESNILKKLVINLNRINKRVCVQLKEVLLQYLNSNFNKNLENRKYVNIYTLLTKAC